ncbi:MAG: molecular chaperone HtpG [Gammaproteobacteria bacterium]|nr:MAG: molecular chaperone HtpG [Gammaproteobacteria bacterium]
MSETDASTANGETMQFQAEVSQLLKLMIHSLYSNQEIFLRELVSNASDALDKLRFEALGNDALTADDLRIVVAVDKDAGTVTVSDNGIGMTHDEVVANIGTIAKSGTRQFLESLTGDQKTDSKLIGQFGVGFYSSFVVADRVELVTRKAGAEDDLATRWSSAADGSYTIGNAEKATRGTDVILHIKDDCKEFLDDWRLKSIIKKYSDHITFPIMMAAPPAPTAEDDATDEAAAGENDAPELEQVNDAKALWTRPKSEVSEEEYQDFYKQVFHDFENPLRWTHNKVEGKYEYTSLFYIPARAPFDLYDANQQRHGIKLFVQRVFIMDDAEKLMPRYLRFVRGLVDSNDLPLNVSREILQNNRVIESIRSASVKRVLGELEKMAEKEPEQYRQFWEQFGACLKEAPGEDFAHREQVAKLYRFDTTHTGKQGEWTGLDDYIARMKPGQHKIYYITADSFAAAKHSPHMEVFTEKGIEVLLMHDRVDEWMMSYLGEYEGKSFVSIAKGDLDLSGIEGDAASEADSEEKAKKAEEVGPTIERIGKVLEDKVSEVRASTRLTSSPACVVMGEHDMALHMQQLLKQAGHELPESKPALEVNPSHPILDLMDKESDEERFADWAHLLLDQALLADGAQLEDSAGFVRRMNEMFVALKA